MNEYPQEAAVEAEMEAGCTSRLDIEAEMKAEEEAENARNNEVMASVKGMVSERDYDKILEELDEGGYVHSFTIVNAPQGDEQCEEYEHGYRFVNQTTNGGYTGDEYAGDVFIPVGQGQWFKFSYSM